MLNLTLLDLKEVSFASGEKTILRDISFSVRAGDFISIVGSSGSGKSTLLRLCAHLVSPTDGKVLYKGIDMNKYNPAELRKSISYCSQAPYLFGTTVMDNLDFPFSIRNERFNEERANELFCMFRMSPGLMGAAVHNLSGGEKQRIALIRSLLFMPHVLLLDEITSALDMENTRIVEEVISSLNKDGITIMWITHNTEQSQRCANKIMTLETGGIKSLELLR